MQRQQRGMALLVVLLMIAMMTLLATTSNQYGNLAVAQAGNRQAMLQAKWDLLGAEQWFLTTQPLQQPFNAVRQQQFGEQLLHFRLRDRQACFNLNALLMQRVAEDQQPALPSLARQLFLRMLGQLGLKKEEADRLMQQLIASVKPDPQVNKWRLFDEVSQLRTLPAVTPSLWQKLQPLLCVTPETRLNINVNGLTARQMPLFSALFAGQLSSTQLQSLLDARPPEGWKDIHALVSGISSRTLEPAIATLQSVVVTESRYFELLIWGDHPTIFSALRSRVEQQDESYRVTARLYGLSE